MLIEKGGRRRKEIAERAAPVGVGGNSVYGRCGNVGVDF